jgi:hypothetical protein
MTRLVLALLFASLVGLSSATTYYLSPANTTWATTIQDLKAGDTAVLAAYVCSSSPLPFKIKKH